MRIRNSRGRAGALAALLLAALACQSDNARISGPAGQSAFRRFVAIGTDLSMGVQSDGVNYDTQGNAWPALLAHLAQVPFSQPLFATVPGSTTPYPPAAAGCPSPLVAPLSSGLRLSGARLGVDTITVLGELLTGYTTGDVACTTFSGDSLPTNDIAIDGATTYDALVTTIDSAKSQGFNRDKLYEAVLPPKRSQLSAAFLRRPTLVSLELGAREVLSAMSSGLVTQATKYPADGTLVPVSVWQPRYQTIVDSLAAHQVKALLLGVPDVSAIGGFYSGDALYQARADGAMYGITVSADCSGSQNLVFVPAIVPTLAAQAASSGSAVTLSCADHPGAQDHILTPTEVSAISAVVSAMNTTIQAAAQTHGWAYVDVTSALHQRLADRLPFSFSAVLTSTYPYGQYTSLDGIHPNNQGHQVVANAAADALNAQYGFTLPVSH